MRIARKAAHPFVIALLLLPASSLGATNAQREHYAVVRAVTLADAPATAASELGPQIAPGTIVDVTERRGEWVRVENTGVGSIGWAPTSTLVPIARFRRISRWQGVARADVGDGDYDAYYRFGSDGSFRVRETVGDEAPYKLTTRKGHLYRYRHLVWARIPGRTATSERMFITTATGEFCWQGYMDGRCGNER